MEEVRAGMVSIVSIVPLYIPAGKGSDRMGCMDEESCCREAEVAVDPAGDKDEHGCP